MRVPSFVMPHALYTRRRGGAGGCDQTQIILISGKGNLRDDLAPIAVRLELERVLAAEVGVELRRGDELEQVRVEAHLESRTAARVLVIVFFVPRASASPRPRGVKRHAPCPG